MFMRGILYTAILVVGVLIIAYLPWWLTLLAILVLILL